MSTVTGCRSRRPRAGSGRCRRSDWGNARQRHLQAHLLVIQIDGLHVAEDIVLIGVIGIDRNGEKHILGLVEGAIENAAVAHALLDNRIERRLDPKLPRLFVLDARRRCRRRCAPHSVAKR